MAAASFLAETDLQTSAPHMAENISNFVLGKAEIFSKSSSMVRESSFFHFVRKPEMYWLYFQVKILFIQNSISIGIFMTSAEMKQGYSNYLVCMDIHIYNSSIQILEVI